MSSLSCQCCTLITETYKWEVRDKSLSGLQNKFSLSFPDLLGLQSLKDRVYLSVDLLMLGRYQIVPTVIVLFIVFNLLPHCLNTSQLSELLFFVKEDEWVTKFRWRESCLLVKCSTPGNNEFRIRFSVHFWSWGWAPGWGLLQPKLTSGTSKRKFSQSSIFCQQVVLSAPRLIRIFYKSPVQCL